MRGISGINESAAAAAEEPIAPPVQVDHTQLLIDGQFVDAASGWFLTFFFLVQDFFPSEI